MSNRYKKLLCYLYGKERTIGDICRKMDIDITTFKNCVYFDLSDYLYCLWENTDEPDCIIHLHKAGEIFVENLRSQRAKFLIPILVTAVLTIIAAFIAKSN